MSAGSTPGVLSQEFFDQMKADAEKVRAEMEADRKEMARLKTERWKRSALNDNAPDPC